MNVRVLERNLHCLNITTADIEWTPIMSRCALTGDACPLPILLLATAVLVVLRSRWMVACVCINLFDQGFALQSSVIRRKCDYRPHNLMATAVCLTLYAPRLQTRVRWKLIAEVRINIFPTLRTKYSYKSSASPHKSV